MRYFKLMLVGLFTVLMGCTKGEDIPTDPGWTDPDGGETSPLTVMSYNTHHSAPYSPSGETTLPDIDGIANVIKSKNPDIVLLQEIDSCTNRSQKVDQAKEIAEKTKYPYYHFFKMMDYQGGKYGLAMLSKFPIKDAVAVQLPDEIEGQPMTGNNAYGTATVNCSGKDITFVVCHLSVTQSERDLQMPYIIGKVSAMRKPIIWGGDFNATPSNKTITQLDGAGFVRTNKNPANFTIPSNQPNREIDYIAYFPANAFTVTSHIVVTGTMASDHLPIVSALTLNN